MTDILDLRDEAMAEELDELYEDIDEDGNDLEIGEIALGARLEVEDE